MNSGVIIQQWYQITTCKNSCLMRFSLAAHLPACCQSTHSSALSSICRLHALVHALAAQTFMGDVIVLVNTLCMKISVIVEWIELRFRLVNGAVEIEVILLLLWLLWRLHALSGGKYCCKNILWPFDCTNPNFYPNSCAWSVFWKIFATIFHCMCYSHRPELRNN